MTWNPKNITNETRYYANNPPPDRETAERKVNDLRDSISRIDIDLDEREIESFSDEVEYEDWRARALTALVHIKAEARFLDEWLQLQKKKDASQAFTDRVASLTKNVQTRTNDLQPPPTNLTDAQHRLRVLTELRDEIAVEYADLMELGKDTGSTKREVTEKLNSLRALTEAVESERRSIKDYISAKNPNSMTETEEALPAPAQKIFDFVQASTAVFVKERAKISGPNNSPSDLDDAKHRRMTCVALRSKVMQDIQKVAEMWREYPYTKKMLKFVHRPLVDLNVSLDEEVRYLNSYIEDSNREIEKGERQARKARKETIAAKKAADANLAHELQQANQRIRKRVEEIAMGINNSYSALYTDVRSPVDLKEAHQRQELASSTKIRLQNAFSEITDAWCQYPLRRKDLVSVKRPLTEILSALELELGIARRFIAAQNQQPSVSRRGWKSICTAALTRAAFEGFKLTDEERAVVQELIADLGGKS